MNTIGRFIYFIFAICTAMVGYQIHNSIFWSIMDFIFTFWVWAKWLICHEVTLAIIRDTFSWFLG